MTINVYDVGDTARVTGLFYDANGNLADPSALTFSFKDPSGTTTTYTYGSDAEVVRSTTGTYYVDLTFDELGMWHYIWVQTGTRAGAEKGQFRVKPREVTP